MPGRSLPSFSNTNRRPCSHPGGIFKVSTRVSSVTAPPTALCVLRTCETRLTHPACISSSDTATSNVLCRPSSPSGADAEPVLPSFSNALVTSMSAEYGFSVPWNFSNTDTGDVSNA